MAVVTSRQTLTNPENSCEFSVMDRITELLSLDRNIHLTGLLKLIEPSEKDRAKRAFETRKSRAKWLEKRLSHSVGMHPEYTKEAPRGKRDEASLLSMLRDLGAPEECYIVASDHEIDDRFQSLSDVLENRYAEFGHGTIFSCIPGKLALFRSAYPHKSFIIHRK